VERTWQCRTDVRSDTMSQTDKDYNVIIESFIRSLLLLGIIVHIPTLDSLDSRLLQISARETCQRYSVNAFLVVLD